MKMNEWEVCDIREADNLEKAFCYADGCYRGMTSSRVSDFARLKHVNDERYTIAFRLERYHRKKGNKKEAQLWAERRDAFYGVGTEVHAESLRLTAGGSR